MRVALYARVSTDKQVEKYGIPSQVEAMSKWCLEKNWVPFHDGDKEAFIDDGYTGADLDRPALERLRRLAEEGRMDAVLAYDPDRLSRKLVHLMILAEEFEKHGVKLEFVTQEMGDSPEQKMFFNMRGTFAEYEREKIRERTMRGRRTKALQGKVANTGAIAFGFRLSQDRENLEEDIETAEALRLIFTLFVNERLSLTKLAVRLDQLGIATPRRGQRWRASTLARILSNEAYIGRLYQFRQHHVQAKRHLKDGKGKYTSATLRPREEWIMVPVPAIVPLELFEAAQRRLKANTALAKRNTKREYLLAGILHCGFCGGRLGGHHIHGLTYYRCYHRHRERYLVDSNGTSYPCPCPEIRGDSVETVVWKTVTGLMKKPDVLIAELKRCKEPNSTTREAIEKELKLSQARLNSIPKEKQRLVDGYGKGLYDDAMMQIQMDALSKEQTELTTRKIELERQLEARELTDSQEKQLRALSLKIKSGLRNLDFNGKQELLRLLIESVRCDGEKIEIQTVLTLNNELNPVHREGRVRVIIENN